MNCRSATDYILAWHYRGWLGGIYTEATLRAVANHLDTCPCAAEARSMMEHPLLEELCDTARKESVASDVLSYYHVLHHVLLAKALKAYHEKYDSAK